MSYFQIKKISGKEYLYEMETYREGKSTKTKIVKYHGSMEKPSNQLLFKQKMNSERKLSHTLNTIIDFYEKMNGKVYISFSGGKDSTVLLHLVRGLYPEVPAVFVDTGLEFPEVRNFIKTIPNVIWLKPEILFTKVIEEYGYPVVSKLVSTQVRVLRNPTENNIKTTSIYNNGYQNSDNINSQFKFADKWKFLVDAPFKISEKCCKIMKHAPIEKYEKETGLKPFIGTMAADSAQRKTNYFKTSCNSFNGSPKSRPLSIWSENDIWDYISQNNIPYSKIYDLGWDRTGCMFCMFGIHMEKENRFDRMKITHPGIHKYCMENLGMKKVLDYISGGTTEKIKEVEKLMDLLA